LPLGYADTCIRIVTSLIPDSQRRADQQAQHERAAQYLSTIDAGRPKADLPAFTGEPGA